MHSRILLLPDARATEELGRALSSKLQGGIVITLTGQLGAGKTTLVRGVLRGFDIAGPVKSPTYTLVEPYTISKLYLYHFDFYRLKDPSEWEEAGFREYFRDDAICMIEWPEKAGQLLPAVDLAITLDIVAQASELPEQRRCTLSALTARAEPCLAAADRYSRLNP